MDNDVDDGDSNAAVTGYATAGKTGTAQVGDDGDLHGVLHRLRSGGRPGDRGRRVRVRPGHLHLRQHVLPAPPSPELTTFALQNQGIAPTGVPGRELENEW